MRYDAIIFDVDGVLVEPTDPDVHRSAVRRALSSFDIEAIDAQMVEQLVELTGDDRDQLTAETVEVICEQHGVEPESFWRERERLAAEAQLREVEAGRKARYPDARVVEELARNDGVGPLAAISNNQHQLVAPMLKAHDLWAPFAVSYGREPSLEGVRRRKPDPYYAQRAMEDLGVTEPVMVGDSEVDIQAARRLGIDAVFVRRAHRDDYELATATDYEIRSLTELPRILRR